MNKFFLLAFVLAGSLLRSADSTSQVVECEGVCSEDLRISCDDLLDQYTIQGSCCNFEPILAYNGCRVKVGGGNCYWFPKCEECPLRTEGRWQNVKCGLEYRGAPGTTCNTTAAYPTNWKNPPVEGPWNDYSCSPTAAPRTNAPAPSASSSISVHALALAGMIVAAAQM